MILSPSNDPFGNHAPQSRAMKAVNPMNPESHESKGRAPSRLGLVARTQKGQTLVIALITLGILLLLGFVFLGLINNNIKSANRYKQRTVAEDLAEAGARYVHGQMLNGSLGADWRGLPTPPIATGTNPNLTQDPDALYLRPASGLAFRADDPTQVDLGGPDGLGFYTRFNFQNGRALVRVRYAPSDANIFSASPAGALRNPGRARNYLIIESVGRQGAINPNDPTSVTVTQPVQFQGFASASDLQAALSALQVAEKGIPTSPKQIAFVSVGIIESALYIDNKDHVSRPAEIGVSTELGAIFGTTPVAPVQVMGTSQKLFNSGLPPTLTNQSIGLGGSIWCNADLMIHGNVQIALNATLGDLFAITGTMVPADGNAKLTLNRNEYVNARPGYPAAWYGGYPATSPTDTPLVLSGSQLNSRAGFSTAGGVLRDGIDNVDSSGFPRSAAFKAPPSMETRDPQTGTTRYEVLTRESGSIIGTGNSGRFGYGSGPYVDNFEDLQISNNDNSRLISGGGQSLIQDWLNPNNNSFSMTGWQGPFYVPVGAFLQLIPDGFTITRDAPGGNSAHAFWKAPDGTIPLSNGTPVNTPSIRYRLGRGSDNKVHIVNTFTPGIGNVNQLNPPNTFYDMGPAFNGVLYFEGNVRVRGTIPTDVQLTVVSNGSVYVEGSVVRGITNNDVSGGAANTPLTRPSKSTCMLIGRQYVALNTTQFFGPATSGGYQAANDNGTPNGIFPARISNDGTPVTFASEVLLDPNPINVTTPATDPNNPSTWQPYGLNYQAPGGGALYPNLVVTHATDAGNAPTSFFSINVNPGLPSSPYLFPLSTSNAATPILTNNGTQIYTEPTYSVPGFASVYGLGIDPWQIYSKLETVSFPLLSQNFTWSPATFSVTGNATNPFGTYSLLGEGTNYFSFYVNNSTIGKTADYMLGRFAIVPDDIRIEASMFAEEGSFFVIPGGYFNPDPQDSRDAYNAAVAGYVAGGQSQANATILANQDRLNAYGAFPERPFYGEPLDVKISVLGSISENMTPPIAQQAEYQRKWGWIPNTQGATGVSTPTSHQVGASPTQNYGTNLILSYDPVLATGRLFGFSGNNDPVANPYVRTDDYGRALPPMPRLPVSPTLAFFGEENF
jgi:hypothetical protein